MIQRSFSFASRGRRMKKNNKKISAMNKNDINMTKMSTWNDLERAEKKNLNKKVEKNP